MKMPPLPKVEIIRFTLIEDYSLLSRHNRDPCAAIPFSRLCRRGKKARRTATAYRTAAPDGRTLTWPTASDYDEAGTDSDGGRTRSTSPIRSAMARMLRSGTGGVTRCGLRRHPALPKAPGFCLSQPASSTTQGYAPKPRGTRKVSRATTGTRSSSAT